MLQERDWNMTDRPRDKKGGRRLLEEGLGDMPRKRTEKEKIVMVVMIAAAVFMVILATVVVLWTRWVKKPTLPSPSGPSAPVPVSMAPGSSQSLDPQETETPYELDFDPVEPKVGGERKSEDYYTILVFGADVVSGLTDTIMLVSYDVTNQSATVMSIPRDTQVNVRTRWSKSINGVYYANGKDEKGIKALKNEVSELVGFDPDYYIMIDWEIVGKMVDAIGGVDYDVPWHMGYSDDTQGLDIYFEPGMQHLDGKRAMELVRWRKNNDGTKSEGGGSDLNRLKLQHDFLKAVLKQTLQLKNVTKVGQLSELFGENVVSDLTIENLFWFAQSAIFGGLEVDDVNFVTMPYYGVETGVYKNKVFPSQKALLELINGSLNPFAETVTIRQLDLMRVSSDGNTMSSSTGVLADPSVAIPPSESPSPGDEEDDDPLVSGEPFESWEPGESGAPAESGAPSQSESPAVSGQPGQSPQPTGELPVRATPSPTQEPTPTPEPTPEPTPTPAPEPTPEPTSTPTPEPTPAPSNEIPDWLLPPAN